MPTDLDEMFQALGRDADALALAGADDARRRGVRRNRIRTVVSAAAAVAVALAGIGVALHGPSRHPAPPAVTPSPGPREAGSVAMGTGGVAAALTAQDGKRAYAAWTRADDGRTWLVAADLRTGRPAWRSPNIVAQRDSLVRLVAAPSAVAVFTRAPDGSTRLRTFDPATGESLGTGELGADDSAVFAGGVRVQSSPVDGRIWGGRTHDGGVWSETLTQDRPLRTLAMTTSDDEKRIDRAGPRLDHTSGRVVVVMAGGQVQVRNATTGEIEHTASVPATSGATMVAYEGWLFSHDEADGSAGPQHIRATDLAGGRGSTIVGAVPGPFRTLAGCGPERVCVVTGNDPGATGTTLTVIDAAQRRRMWQATTRYGGDVITSAGGYTAVSAAGGGYELFDPAGGSVYGSAATTGWLDAGALLVDDGGRLSLWSVAGRRATPLGQAPKTVGGCTSTSDLLICAAPGSAPNTGFLKLWRLR